MFVFLCILFIKGLLLVCFVMYAQQAAISTPLSDEEFDLEKRRIDAHSRTSIPLFRGSNLGIFVRKRPFAVFPEHSVIRRKETRSTNEDNILAELLYNNEHLQRRFDDYSENPGPMFGR
jgi:hypothetical protein